MGKHIIEVWYISIMLMFPLALFFPNRWELVNASLQCATCIKLFTLVLNALIDKAIKETKKEMRG